ncbi:hypothetical protein DUNSADRAFT_15999 [Dunaliella salina]|uniref:WW domain-containing protein n=1 Tax=Dunaliella salina TaxID=3046 RepID=A0ABQ7G4F8_DUNSA|nr:hypothetical protein DUNSADRAFT_15999 [Dunaliella salina]|eukprot:KAF5829490.1 hypothetical protein DUNSADRAFT_15999 [Dunaliella salina]
MTPAMMRISACRAVRSMHWSTLTGPGTRSLTSNTGNPEDKGDEVRSKAPAASTSKEPQVQQELTTSTQAVPHHHHQQQQHQQQQQQESQEAPAWIEVVHEETGQTYYWNQKTGQTTELNDPRPHGWRHSSGGSSDQGNATGGGGPRGFVDPRAEAPLEDKTGTYAAVGAGMGVFLGWASQFF